MNNNIKNSELRCIKCHKQFLINIITKTNNIKIKLTCECGINYESFEGLNNILKHEINKYNFCYICFSKNNIKFCKSCCKFLCENCINSHSKDHLILSKEEIDNYCYIDKKIFKEYCLDCKENICEICVNQHKNHKIVNIENFKYTNNEYKNLKNNFSEMINNLNEYNLKLKNDSIKLLNDEIKKIEEIYNINKTLNEKIINFLKLMFNSYENNINITTILNLKNNTNFFKIPNLIFSKYQSLESKINQSISYFKENYIIKSNYLLFEKYIYAHHGSVNKIIELDNGCILSCSSDKSINIIDPNNYKVILNNKFSHNDSILDINILSNGDIISCSKDKIINIWKINDNKLILKKRLIGHTSEVNNVFQFKLNEYYKNFIISCSKNEIIFWKIINENIGDIINFKKIEISSNNLLEFDSKYLISSCENYLYQWEYTNNDDLLKLCIQKNKSLITNNSYYKSKSIIKKLDKQKIIFSENYFICIINASNLQIINKIKCRDSITFILIYNNIILISDIYKIYLLNKNTYEEIQTLKENYIDEDDYYYEYNDYDEYINYIIRLKNGKFVLGYRNNSIEILKE